MTFGGIAKPLETFRAKSLTIKMSKALWLAGVPAQQGSAPEARHTQPAESKPRLSEVALHCDGANGRSDGSPSGSETCRYQLLVHRRIDPENRPDHVHC